ncbi:MAG TPA: glycoside hydrolase family 15 protein [Jiangellaceae bacterium]|nr:glycoside hydrolase family 15 protein [Jiangellaceae bacterium]
MRDSPCAMSPNEKTNNPGDEAIDRFEDLLSLRDDLGLLAEEYDPRINRMVGNFPQAMSHIPLVTAALLLSGAGQPPTGRA